MSVSKQAWMAIALGLACLSARAESMKQNPDEVLNLAHLPTEYWFKDAWSEKNDWTVLAVQTPTSTRGGNCLAKGMVWGFRHVQGSGKATVTDHRELTFAYFNPAKGLACASIKADDYADVEYPTDVDKIGQWIMDMNQAVQCTAHNQAMNCGPWKGIYMVFVNTEETQKLDTLYLQNFSTLPQRKVFKVISWPDHKSVDILFAPSNKGEHVVGCRIEMNKDGSRKLTYGLDWQD